jgi:hypothetical protein
MSKPQDFKPGDPRINRKGAPVKEWTWAGLIRKKMDEMLPGEDKKFIKDAVATSLAEKAISGDVQAIKEIGDRIDGKPQQFIDHSTMGDKINPTFLVATQDAKESLEQLYAGSNSSNDEGVSR